MKWIVIICDVLYQSHQWSSLSFNHFSKVPSFGTRPSGPRPQAQLSSLFQNSELMWSRIYFVPPLKTTKTTLLETIHSRITTSPVLLQKIYKNPEIYREVSPQHRQRCCPVDPHSHLVQSALTWLSREQPPTKTPPPPTHPN